MSETITIRTLGPDEAEVLDRVRDGVFRGPVDPAQAWAFLATGANVMVVALERGDVVGFASGTVILYPDKPRGFLVTGIAVHESLRRRGIGTRLMLRLREIAAERGCGKVWLVTEEENGPARGFYRSLGAVETPGLVMAEWDLSEG